MFGHQDDTPQTQDAGVNAQPAAVDTSAPAAATFVPTEPPQPVPTPPADPAPAATGGSTAPALLEEHEEDGITAPADAPAAESSAPAADDNAGNDDLLDIKQHALQQLSPLVDHLDQSPEEKFRTTMMMIQASDNQALISTAYEAANKISDEKARAQALLDIVNEINYFTQHPAD